MRLAQNQRDTLAALARRAGCSQSEMARRAIAVLAAAPAGQATDALLRTLAAVAVTLGLPRDALPQDVMSALQTIVSEVGSGDSSAADPTAAGAADPTSAFAGLSVARPYATAALSAREVATTAKMTPAQLSRFTDLRADRAAGRAPVKRMPRRIAPIFKTNK